MENDKKLLSAEELHQLKQQGYESRGAMFAKDNKFVSNKEIDDIVSQIRETSPFRLIEKRLDVVEKDLVDVYDYVTTPDADGLTKRVDGLEKDVYDIYDYVTTPDKPTEQKPVEKEALAKLSSIADGMSQVAVGLSSVENVLRGLQTAKKADEYKTEETKLEAVSVSKPKPAATSKREDTSSISSLLKDFFTNPAVIAAFSGIVYLFLPKDVKERINGFFSGFAEGAMSTKGELSSFEKGLVIAGAGLATYLGASALQKVGEALTTVTQLIVAARKKFGKYFGKGGMKELGKDIATKAPSAGAVAAGVAGAGTAAVLMSGDEKKPETKVESKPSPSATPAPVAAPTPAPESAPSTQVPGTGIKPGTDSGLGVKPGKGGLGLKAERAPTMTGDDKSIMEMIKKHEGVRTRPYKDSLGLWTVGVGHLIGNGKSLPPEMNREFSMAEVDAMFAEDYKHHKEAAQKIPGFEKLNESGKAALIDLTFNMGPAWYKRWPNFSKALAGGDTEGAAKSLEDSKWYTQVGNRARTIVSLIRGGGSNSGTVLASSTPSATQEKTTPATGERVATASMAVEAAGTGGGKPTVINNNLEGSKIAQGKGAPQAPMSIPAPIANRGSLDSGTRYSSAYAS